MAAHLPGVRHLVAAYDPASGRLWVHLHARKTWRGVRELLRTLRARWDEQLIVVLHNCSPRKKADLWSWAAGHDIELVLLPTYSSWLGLIECQFQALRSFALNGSDYQSHAEQDAAIRAYLRWHNRHSRPARPWRLNAEVHRRHRTLRHEALGAIWHLQSRAVSAGSLGTGDSSAWPTPWPPGPRGAAVFIGA